MDTYLKQLLEKFPHLSAVSRSRLKKIASVPVACERLERQMAKITSLVSQPRIQEAFLRSYLRIYANRIDKDGRHGSLVIEITKRCNQDCRHCYSRAQAHKNMPEAVLKKILRLARKNYKHIFITGGEPVLDKRVLSIARDNPDMMFFMFTNGSLIDRDYAAQLAKTGNLIPVLSIDGENARQHDYFKGPGSWRSLMRAIGVLTEQSMPWGFLSMVTNTNARQVLSRKFIRRMKEKGAILARYLEYIPVGPGAREKLVPSAKTYFLMEKRKREIIANYEIYMQETAQKKCLGLLFFDVDGNIKCCPFFHYAKHNILSGSPEKSIRDSSRDWCQARYPGECPLYSDHQGLRAHLISRGWNPTVSFNPANAISPDLAKIMSKNYSEFLRLKNRSIG